ncbi:hypothetical protein KKA23_02230 [Patescibacteria group bacterium]|nr:hypothetical protein [Patescibacteria group bacterium]
MFPQKNSKKINQADTWQTYRDEKLGFEIKHPTDCNFSTDMGGNITGISECEKYTTFRFEEIPSIPDFSKFNIEEVSKIYHKAMKEDNNKNKPDNRFLSDIEEIIINGIKVYQFTFDWADCKSFNNDYSCNGGGLVEEKTILTFMESNRNKKIKFEMFENDKVANKILSTLKLID